MDILLGERYEVKETDNLGESSTCTLVASRRRAVRSSYGDKRARIVPEFFHSSPTGCPHVLCIEFLPDFRYLFTNHEIKFDSFFNLFDGVDGGGVVFTAKLTGNLWKT